MDQESDQSQSDCYTNLWCCSLKATSARGNHQVTCHDQWRLRDEPVVIVTNPVSSPNLWHSDALPLLDDDATVPEEPISTETCCQELSHHFSSVLPPRPHRSIKQNPVPVKLNLNDYYNIETYFSATTDRTAAPPTGKGKGVLQVHVPCLLLLRYSCSSGLIPQQYSFISGQWSGKYK